MKAGTIPSPRQLKLSRFNRPDFRSTTKRGKRAAGWTWSRALYRLRRFHQQWNAALDRDIIEPFRALVRAIMVLKARHPVWQGARRPELDYQRALMREQAREEWAMVLRQTGQRQPHPRRTVGISGGESAREQAPSRLSTRRTGAAHRLENLKALPHQAYLTAMDARNQYVTANLLRLKGLAATRAFGEPSWREQRRADRSEFAAA